jgi:hypothetical protein
LIGGAEAEGNIAEPDEAEGLSTGLNREEDGGRFPAKPGRRIE